MSATPGPWKARQQMNQGKSLGWIIETENGSRIGWSAYADAVTNEGEGAPYEISGANAHLIAAAPALLEAAKELIQALDWDGNILELNDEEFDAMREKYPTNADWIDAAQTALISAISEAEGTK